MDHFVRTIGVNTKHRLSITEWRPVTGSLPPTSMGDWESEFTKYKSSPEFKQLNPNMSLSEFKSIYYMEWGHRLWGRVVGLGFVLPAIYFISRKKISANIAVKVAGIASLIGFQGLIGWWMVKSGLRDDLFAPGSHPRVSQYRLTAHLGTAFLCYTAMLWNGLSILREHRLLSDPVNAEKTLSALRRPELKVFRRSVAGLAALVFCTAMSGGLVAGLDAGLIYNEFPYMGLGLTPPKSELFSDFYSHNPDRSDIWWRNMLENPSLVQLDHRILATSTFTAVMGLWAYTKLSSNVKNILPAACKRGMHGVVGFVWLQVILGISTLIYLVPLPLASAHQAGSLALLSSVLVLGGRTWVPGRASKLVAQRLGRAVEASRATHHNAAMRDMRQRMKL
jgi:cytochrome c oxidase assembly protein subunit 15